MIHPITISSVNVTSNPKPKCPTFWFVKLFVCEELRPAAGGEGTLVALLVARQPVVQPAAAGWGQEVTMGLPGGSRELPAGYQGGAGATTGEQRFTRGSSGNPQGEQRVTRREQRVTRGEQGVTRGLPEGAVG